MFWGIKGKVSYLNIDANYLIWRQRQIPTAYCTIHNFIWRHHTINRLFEEYSIQDMIVYGEQGIEFQEGINIANQIWENYRRGR